MSLILPESALDIFLSLLNLCNKRASPLSCLPVTYIMLYNHIGPVSTKRTFTKIRYIQTYHAKANSSVDLFYLLFPACLSRGRLFLDAHNSVTKVCACVSCPRLPRHGQWGRYKNSLSHTHYVTSHHHLHMEAY